MIRFRRSLRLAALVWMVSYPLAIPALACLECCADHQAPAVAEPAMASHAEPEPAACHRMPVSEAPPAEGDGTLRSTCSGPAAALAAALDNQGDVPVRAAVAAPGQMSLSLARLDARPIFTPVVPDPPPPQR